MVKTKYCTIFGTDGQVNQFLQDIPHDLDYIIERVMVNLEMYPNFMDMRIYLYDTKEEVQQKYFAIFSRKCDYRAFMSKTLKNIYLAVSDFNTDILVHELGHMVLEYKFPNFPSKFHEDFAKHCVKYIEL